MQVVLVEVGDRAGVVDGELLVGDVVDPRAHNLADELAAGLTADGLGDHADCVLRLDEAQRHCADCRRRGGRHFFARQRPCQRRS